MSLVSKVKHTKNNYYKVDGEITMAKIKLKYKAIVEEVIDWPDDELKNLTYDNLLLNYEVCNARYVDYDEIVTVSKDGEEFEFE